MAAGRDRELAATLAAIKNLKSRSRAGNSSRKEHEARWPHLLSLPVGGDERAASGRVVLMGGDHDRSFTGGDEDVLHLLLMKLVRKRPGTARL